jgi:UDP-N-acetylmuramate--alanine ligase
MFSAIKNQGIKIYPQDGSFAGDGLPDFLVYSTAIEEDNPDFLAAGETPRLHRSALLEKLMNSLENQKTIAVTGSCGKSTVTAYLAETLFNLGLEPSCLNGALSKRFKSAELAGNFRPGTGEYFVFEADESDKSLLNYQVDHAIILNIGTDHYSKEELAEVFGRFLGNVRKSAVLSSEVYDAVKSFIPDGLPIQVFYSSAGEGKKFALQDYFISDHKAHAVFSGYGELVLPICGRHNALNALAILTLLDMLGIKNDSALQALERFDGIFRRTDFAGKTKKGALVFDDYAHNPEKIISCLDTMREIGGGRIFAVFQPHGFGPLGFMRDQLFLFLEKALLPDDRFILLEPYYAGGTTSFKPTSAEVMTDWQNRAARKENYLTFANREDLSPRLLEQANQGDIIVIMGARDNSLSDYAIQLTQ